MEAATARNYPARIEATLFDLVLIREKIATRQEQLAEINDLLLLEAITQVDESGNRLNFDSELRGLALRNLQRAHRSYQEQKSEIEDLNYQKERLLAQLERLRSEFKMQLAERLNPDAGLDRFEDFTG